MSYLDSDCDVIMGPAEIQLRGYLTIIEARLRASKSMQVQSPSNLLHSIHCFFCIHQNDCDQEYHPWMSDVNRREVMSDIFSEEYEPIIGVSWHAMDAGPTFVP